MKTPYFHEAKINGVIVAKATKLPSLILEVRKSEPKESDLIEISCPKTGKWTKWF